MYNSGKDKTNSLEYISLFSIFCADTPEKTKKLIYVSVDFTFISLLTDLG